MDFSEGTALEIVERLCSAYGVTTQKALAESIGVPAANVSNWVQRDSVPGSAFVKCALDTGSDLYWLTTGKLANASLKKMGTLRHGKALYDEILSSGGKPVLRRIMEAYGFTLQKQLCDLLGISSGTVSTWVRRDYFPGDVVVTCALDTGVSLEWLATGKGTSSGDTDQGCISASYSVLKKYNIDSGVLKESGEWICDKSFFDSLQENCGFVEKGKDSWIVDFEQKNLGNGWWLIDIDGSYDVYNVVRIPGNKIQINNRNSEFQCNVTDIICVGHVKKTILEY